MLMRLSAIHKMYLMESSASSGGGGGGVLQLHDFVEFMASEAVHPLPLKLNVEPEGDQEFL